MKGKCWNSYYHALPDVNAIVGYFLVTAPLNPALIMYRNSLTTTAIIDCMFANKVILPWHWREHTQHFMNDVIDISEIENHLVVNLPLHNSNKITLKNIIFKNKGTPNYPYEFFIFFHNFLI